MRDYQAYGTPSGIILGMGLRYLWRTVLLLIQKSNTRHTILYQLSCLACFLVSVMSAVQIVLLDFFSSPYYLDYSGYLLVVGYALNALSTILISILMLYRILVVYGLSHKLTWSMFALAVVVVAGKIIGNFYGIATAWRFQTGQYSSPTQDPLFGNVARGVFLSICSVAFLYGLTLSWDLSEHLKVASFMQTFLCLMLILATNIANAVLATVAAVNDNYISHVGFYLTGFSYALTIYTFVDLSYVTARELILSQLNSQPKSGSGPKLIA
ncbi:hypothetical protein HDU91_002599 [Kappamyces sp. JEL0680]|nr:hypothetical protein HDU91_002599 [Kappamyces sp. JEL0680]